MAPEVAAALTTPIVASAAVAAGLLVLLARTAVDPVLSLVHEGGHMAVGTLTGLRVLHFRINDVGSAETAFVPMRWGPARILMGIAGYAAPPLVGLGGAALVAAGRVTWALWIAVVVLVLALTKADKEWTTGALLVLIAAVGYVAVTGTPLLQAALASGLVFVLLLGGLVDAVGQTVDDSSDAGKLAHDTWIPRALWRWGFIALALYCLWHGFLLLAP